MSATAGVVLGYEPFAEEERSAGRLWIEAGGSHVVPAVSAALNAAPTAGTTWLPPAAIHRRPAPRSLSSRGS